MPKLKDTEVSKWIVQSYHEKLSGRLDSDVLIAGAGPAGLTAAFYLAGWGMKVTLLEKRLATGGGVWGGGLGMNEVVVQDAALGVLEELGLRHSPRAGGLHTVDAVELAAGLCLRAVQAGAVVLNLIVVEDYCVDAGRVVSLVANRTMIGGALPVDPITFCAGTVIDATGHEAFVVRAVREQGVKPMVELPSLEGPMNAEAGEAFVVENVSEVFPGLWVCGMSVCSSLGGPRMGPIFGGMLLSGKRVAELIAGRPAE